MHTVKSLDGMREKSVNRWVLEGLRMLADWQLRELGYCPMSVTAACAKADEHKYN